jgi:hypothetical protein
MDRPDENSTPSARISGITWTPNGVLCSYIEPVVEPVDFFQHFFYPAQPKYTGLSLCRAEVA